MGTALAMSCQVPCNSEMVQVPKYRGITVPKTLPIMAAVALCHIPIMFGYLDPLGLLEFLDTLVDPSKPLSPPERCHGPEKVCHGLTDSPNQVYGPIGPLNQVIRELNMSESAQKSEQRHPVMDYGIRPQLYGSSCP